jgi:hypothetical protein
MGARWKKRAKPSSPYGSEGEEECEEKFFFFRLVFDSTDKVLFALFLLNN